MKKLLLLGSAALAVMTAAPAAAQVTGTVDVNGFVDDRCLFTVDNAVINLGEISDADGKLDEAAVDAGTATLNGWCNGSAATIQVEAFPLLNSAPGSASFDNRVDYRATATAGSAAPIDDSDDAGPGAEASLGLFSGDIVVDISDSASPNDRLMVAGDYVGSIVVTLTPNTSFGEEEGPGD
jgi:type 1 fimbria pilin